MSSFVHLHVHSQYSLLEATCRFNDLCEQAHAFGMPALAITDYGNMFGAVEFYFSALAAGVKPIVGLEAYLAPKSRHIKGDDKDALKVPNRRLVLLAQNYEGYQNLCKISSVGYQEGFYYRPRVDYEILEKYSDNVIALSGGLMGEVPWQFQNKGKDEAIKKIEAFQKIYGDRFYLELNRTGLKDWDGVNHFLMEVAHERKIPMLAANNVHYLKRGDQIAQEVLICIGSNKTLQDETRFRLGSDQFYFKSAEQMRELFADLPKACDTTLEVADRCNIKFHLKDSEGKPIYHLPSFPTAEGRDTKEEMSFLSQKGLEARFAELALRNETVPEEDKSKYFERLDYELNVIDGMGFNGYFLIVQDFDYRLYK